MDRCLLNTHRVVCISCVSVYPVMFYSSQDIGTNLTVHRCIWSEGVVVEHLFSHWISILYAKFGTVYSKKYKKVFWIENPAPIQFSLQIMAPFTLSVTQNPTGVFVLC